MSTKLFLTVGIIPPGGTAKATTRTIVYDDLSTAITTLTNILITPPFLQYLPLPQVEEPVAPPPVEEQPV